MHGRVARRVLPLAARDVAAAGGLLLLLLGQLGLGQGCRDQLLLQQLRWLGLLLPMCACTGRADNS